MNVAAVEIGGTVAFPEHARLDLPDRGVVLIAGINGSGKSSLCEGVAWALWQRGIRVREDGRPAQPWLDGREARCAVEIRNVGRISTTRSRRGSLAVDVCGTTYETARKAAGPIEALVGSFEVWRRACVYTSADAASFTAASDADRKDLLERMLGLGLFDAAIVAADAAVTEAIRALASAVVEERSAQRELFAAEQALETARGSLSADAPRSDLDVDAGWRRALVDGAAGVREEASRRARLAIAGTKAIRSELRELDGDVATAERAVGEVSAERAAAARALEQAERGRCSACGQAVSPDVLDGLRARVRSATERLGRARSLVVAISGERSEFSDQGRVLESMARADEQAAAVCLAHLERADNDRRRDAVLAELNASVGRLRATLAQASARVVAAETALREQRAARVALVGTRSATLSRAATRLGAAVNAALHALGSRIALDVTPVSSTRGGEVVDRIGVGVRGAGNGQGYGGCSDGQKRLIDIAFLFAVGELARARHPERYGTLWLDEVFLHLDADHKAAAIDFVRDLARDRCVVVVEHDAEFARGLRPDKRVHVERGRLVDG